MGAEHSSGSKKKEDEKHLRMMKSAMEQQRKLYEEKCKELIQEQEKIKAATNNLSEWNSFTQTQANFAPLYPNLQQFSTIATLPSTSSGYSHAQNQSILWQPSAPTAPEANGPPQQTHRKNTKAKKNIHTYQCPTCKMNDLGMNIFQCQQGHSSCSQCKINAVKCGICRKPITKTRNIELERIVANLQINNNVKNPVSVICPNKRDGCFRSLKPENLQTHLKECVFREMECPVSSIKYGECFWRGKINQLQAHFFEYHPNQTGANVDTEMCFDWLNNKYDLHLVAIGNFNFLVHVKLDSNLQTFFMTIQLIGALKTASKWTYEFHVYDKSEPKRKYTYVDTCLPTTNSFSDISIETKCAALPLQYASSFFKDNQMTYKFYITREVFNRRQKKRGNRVCSENSET